MHTHALDNCVTFDLKVNTCQGLPYTVCLPGLVLIAQAIFLLERRHTDPHKSRMQLITLPMH